MILKCGADMCHECCSRMAPSQPHLMRLLSLSLKICSAEHILRLSDRSLIRWGWLGAIREQHSWHMSAPHFKIIASTPLAYNLTHIFSGQGRVRLLQCQKEDVFGSL